MDILNISHLRVDIQIEFLGCRNFPSLFVQTPLFDIFSYLCWYRCLLLCPLLSYDFLFITVIAFEARILIL
jgi:hypothetical protein